LIVVPITPEKLEFHKIKIPIYSTEDLSYLMIKHDTRNMLYAKGFRMVEESPTFYLNKNREED
jgi:hypothetical protein